MKAVIFTKYGSPDVLMYREVPNPAPGDDEILIKVHAVSINSWDWELMIGRTRGGLGGLFKPKYPILGSDVAGVVETVGRNIKRFKPGDEVFGDMCSSSPRGFPQYGDGGFAEYVCCLESTLTIKPEGMTFEQAAAIPQAGVLAMMALHHKRDIKAGQKVLFNGAGGGVGTFGVQIAKSYGAEVTGVDKPGKLDMLKTIGADHVIDHTKEDFTQNKDAYDLIIDAVASRWSSEYKRSLRNNGRCVIIGGKASILFKTMLTGSFGKKKVGLMLYRPNKDLASIIELFEAGKLKPVIDRCCPLDKTSDAFRHFESQKHHGKIIIKVK
jgi:NADPH:quinone reductase-like Zn-dependent oxidoreductase